MAAAISSIALVTAVALPLVAAPFRAFVGFRSDTHASALGWRRVPYIWLGTLFQFGGLAILPFALLVLTGVMIYALFNALTRLLLGRWHASAAARAD